jgi:hypothetical protein
MHLDGSAARVRHRSDRRSFIRSRLRCSNPESDAERLIGLCMTPTLGAGIVRVSYRCDSRGTNGASFPRLRSLHCLGFDAQTAQYVGMLNAGIVDPAKVRASGCKTLHRSRVS